MPYVVLFLFLVIHVTLLVVFGQIDMQTDAMTLRNRESTLRSAAVAVEAYRIETGSFPSGLAAVAASPGFEYVRLAPHQGYALTDALDDGSFRFARATVYSQDPSDGPLDDATFLNAANNSCGLAAFASSTDWCAPKLGGTHYWKQETRALVTADLVRERKRLRRTLDKFIGWYNYDTSVSSTPGVIGNNFPDPGAASTLLTAAISGFTQSATTCTGVYSWHGIPIDCTDLFSVWGTPTVYNYLSATRIALTTRTPYLRSDGTALYVSMEIAL